MKPGLYIVATPIGNPKDITLRALDILQNADAIICEEIRQGSKVMKRLGLPDPNLIVLNEHNEAEATPDIINRLAAGAKFALISDAGTPVFADPGSYLIQEAVKFGIQVVPIPGASSLMAALSILDKPLEKFIFAGFLSQKSDLRENELRKLKSQRLPVILMDTPYRLTRTLEDVRKIYGPRLLATLACDLTQPTEAIFRGTIADILKQARGQKAEFILILHVNVNTRGNP